MRLGKWFVLGLLALPIAEFCTFLLVAGRIGTLGALALLVVSCVAGAVLLQQAGRRQLARLRVAVSDGDITATELRQAGVPLLAGILLLVPGFITDLTALLVLIGPTRRWLMTFIGAAFSHDGRRDGTGRRRGSARDDVIDLSPDEWRRVGDRKVPQRRPKPKDPPIEA
jgi:UPF0716 protein FxsA